MPDQYATVKDLPQAVQDALKGVGYGRADIRVTAASTVVLSAAGERGCRAFVTLINLVDGTAHTVHGSWGGQNMFVRNAVDDDDRAYPMPTNGVIVKGVVGGGRPVYADLYVPASMVDRMLPAPGPELSEQETTALGIFKGYKSSYRREYLDRNRIGAEVIDALVTRGFLSRNRAGATSITTEGKNALASSPHRRNYY